MKIAVLVSGGVDSSVALHMLKAQGHDLVAFYLKIWLEDEMSFLGACPWEEDLSYVEKVCQQCDVPLRIVPLQKEYHDHVVRYTIESVKKGLTPNPDILCNREVKFGAFCEKYGKEFDKIATGHYAQVREGNGDTVELWRAPDPVKDQTYFLALLTQDQLRRALFPIGWMRKSDVRAYAVEHHLATAQRRDSQGICFLGKISFHDFVKAHLGVRPGVFVEKETGKELGEHEGFYFYTIGQRRGIEINNGPWYVCDKDAQKNIVYVTHGYTGADQRKDYCNVEEINWITGLPDKEKMDVKLRHSESIYPCTVTIMGGSSAHVQLEHKDQGITPGQYAVFYDGQKCLGGGVIA